MSHFVVESNLRFSVTITDFGGTLVDPGALRLELTPPSGSKITKVYGTDSELIKDAVGTYHCDLVISGPGGEWKWKWVSTVSAAGADQGIVRVEP